MKVGILFPHQLFEHNILMSTCSTLYLVEEFLFFKQYNFHKQKLIFHRASMKFYESYLRSNNLDVIYIDSFHALSDVTKLIPHLKENGIASFEYLDPTDNWLTKRIKKSCLDCGMEAHEHVSPLFINTPEENGHFFLDKKRMFQTEFYKHQRKKQNILMDAHQKPMGGKWTFDDENRLKYPKGKTPPRTEWLQVDTIYKEAIEYTGTYFTNNLGALDSPMIYPTNFSSSKDWLTDFLDNRLKEFGYYEDAIVVNENILHHSVLTPMLNTGLLTPNYIIQATLEHSTRHDIPLNSLEGFIRQVIGWREFTRAVYELKGVEERTKNFWGFTRKIPPSFWDGTTGIDPIDQTIKKVLATGYCHHIERLMILGNFMLLCEFDPDEVYRWFMEMFIDAYDWVMVPNVYGMSQFADGGLLATKPYISGSNYILKMSNYQKGHWQAVWDGLFWRFINEHRSFFQQNPRLSMLVNSLDRMDVAKKNQHQKIATSFLQDL